MKKKIPLKQKIYLSEYFKGNVAQSFQKESDQRILYWDFDKDIGEKIKMQIEILLNEIVRTIKNREDRRNRYLLPLKCLFCYAEKKGATVLEGITANYASDDAIQQWLERIGMAG